MDPGNNVHSAFNPASTGETIIVATFFDIPADGPLSTPDANQNHCAMEGGCDGRSLTSLQAPGGPSPPGVFVSVTYEDVRAED